MNRSHMQSPFNLSWIIDRGPHCMHERNSFLLMIIYFIEAVSIWSNSCLEKILFMPLQDIIIITFVVLFFFGHMIYRLSAEV